jgi:PAS domain S-box-containing protein
VKRLTEYQSELVKIRNLLEINPRGLTISEISKNIGINRNSVAKYLDVMTISGDIEFRSVGRAKIFYLSQRIPISSLIDYSSDIIFVLNDNNIFTQVNQNFTSFFNIDSSNIIGNDLSKVFTPTQKKKIVSLIENGGSVPTIMKIMEHFFKCKVIPTIFSNGNEGNSIIFEDITLEQKALEALKESDRRFHTFIRASISGMVLTDSDLRVIEINDAGLRISGLKREQVIGNSILDFDVDTKVSGRYDLYKDIINNKISNVVNEVTLPESLGGKRVVVSVFPAGSGIGMVLTDITGIVGSKD